MGKASRRRPTKEQTTALKREQADKPAREQAGKPTSEQESTLTGLQTNKQVGKKAGFLFRPPVHLVLIVLLGLLAYSNTFQSPFQWDETDFIIGNPIVRNLGYFTDISRAEGLPAYDGLKSRYIGYLTFALNYKLHGFNVSGYHVVNLAIHLINAILVYFLVLLTFRTPYFGRGNPLWLPSFGQAQGPAPTNGGGRYSHFFALAVALLFVVHPVQTEAVTYVFQRFASLVSMFYMLSLVLYIKGRFGEMGNGQWAKDKGVPIAYRLSPIAYYVLSLLFAVLAMKTKENAFTLPVVIALYEFLFFSGPVKTRLLRLAPFLLTMLIVPLTIMGSGSTAGEIISQVKDPVSMGYITPAPQDYLFTQFRVIVTYLRLLFLPVGQNIDYDYPLYQSFFTPSVLLSFLFLAAVFGFGVWLLYKSRLWARGHGQEVQTERQRDSEDTPLNPPLPRGEAKGGAIHHSPFTIHCLRLMGFGIIWFFITLSVESSIIPIPMLINEYRAYLPSVGFFLAVVAGATLLIQRFKSSSLFTKIGVVLFALIILGLASATYARNALWSEKISLWEDTARKSPGASRVANNLGIAYYEKGRYDEAIRMYERSISLNSGHVNAYMNLGVAYAVTGRLSEAMGKFMEVIARDPKKSPAYLNLARAYTDLGRPYEAIDSYLKAIAINPNYNSAYHGLGTTYARLGRLDEALAAFTRFVELSPRDPEAYGNRGIVYLSKGDVISARTDFQQACSLGNKASCGYLERLR